MIKIFIKDLRLFITDKKSVFLTFLLPIALSSLFALAYGTAGSNESDVNPISLPIADLDSTDSSIEMIAKLDSLEELRVEQITKDKLLNVIKTGKRSSGLVLYKGFEDSVKAGKKIPSELFYDEAKEIEIGILKSVLYNKLFSDIGQRSIKSQVIKDFNEEYGDILDSATYNNILTNIESKFSNDGESEKTEGSGGGMSIKETSLVGEQTRNLPGLIQAIAGIAIMMLLFSVSSIGSDIIEEKEQGTLKKLMFSPVKASSLLFSKLLTASFVAVVQLIVMFLWANIVFNLDISMNIPGLLLLIVAAAFACSSFGIFLAAIAKSRKQVISLSTIIILIMSAIGGSMIPLFFMPAFMQKISVISVNYWAMEGFFDILWRDATTMQLLPNVGMLFLIGTILTVISVYLFKKNILKFSE